MSDSVVYSIIIATVAFTVHVSTCIPTSSTALTFVIIVFSVASDASFQSFLSFLMYPFNTFCIPYHLTLIWSSFSSTLYDAVASRKVSCSVLCCPILCRFIYRITSHKPMSQGVALSAVVMRLQELTKQGNDNHTNNQAPPRRTPPLGLDAVAAVKVDD